MIPWHGIGTRDDLPLPFWLVVAGAAAVLIITFWVLAFAWRTPRFVDKSGRVLPRLTRFVDSPWVVRPLRIVVGAVWLIAGAALIAGPDRIDNPVFGFVFVWLWVGLVPVSLLFGQVYRRTNPARVFARLTGLVGKPTSGVKCTRWPAAIAITAFGYLELVQPESTTLPVLRGYAAVWVAWLLVGTLLGSRRWIASADPFEAYASAVAHASCWARNAKGQLMAINPLRNLASWQAPRHLSLLASALLGVTLFDALSATTGWVRWTQNLGVAPQLPGAAGLIASIAVIYLAFRLAALPLRDQGQASGAAADRLAPGLIPLVAGYSLAHYGTLLYLEGQRTAFRMSDPLGVGWNLFGGAEAGPDTTLLAFPTAIATTQVLLIVLGHVVGAMVSHDIALRSSRRVTHQLPLLLLMVAITCLGMLLMFSR
ncbi:MAG: hypothetical protein ACK5KO_09200 [Arachnia sp.]